MPENISGLVSAIEMAMEAELKANAFYRNAVAKVTTAAGKNLLQQLADFEQNHYNQLNALKKSLTDQQKFIHYSGTSFQPYQTDVPAEVSGEIETNKHEVLNILNLAIDAETKAATKYRQLAQETADPQGKAMFQKLAEEEMLHRRILSDEFYQMSNLRDVWSWGD